VNRVPSAESQLRFLRDVQAVLEDGQFTATYKFALLTALADLAVELGADDDSSLSVPITAVAAKFVDYYWQQSAPFAGAGRADVLVQNKGDQAAIVRMLFEQRQQGVDSVVRLRSDRLRWSVLVAQIVRVIREQPLHRLQVVAGSVRIFLYPHELRSRTVDLLPGVAFHLRRFHPLVTGLARDRWAALVRGLPANLYAVGQAQDLEAFLFGAGREPVVRHVPLLLDVQSGRCPYCGGVLRSGTMHVDHFVPWSQHRFDAVPNLVVAHDQCNLAKSDRLAAERHLESWVERNRRWPRPTGADGVAFPGIDEAAAVRVAQWAYGRAHDLGVAAWVQGRTTEPLSGRYAAILAG
jgi:hypothetical protein